MVSKTIELPNIKQLFLPDPGMFVCDVDLAQADAQVVAWEADDEILKEIFRDPTADLHNINTKDIFGSCSGSKDKNRPKAKAGVHLTNYGGTPPTLARALGILVREAEDFQTRWFDIHPGIKLWHDRVERALQTTRCVSNAFGYKRFYFDRIERLLPEALAWIPQSTVALIIAKAINNIYYEEPCRTAGVEFLIQVHDSHVTQFPIAQKLKALHALKAATEIVVPYPDPLIIPAGAAISSVSLGDVEDVDWNGNPVEL